MNRTLISMSVAFFILLGCSSRDEVKPTEDSLLTKEAVESIKVIKTAYQEKNRDVLSNRLDEAMASEVTAGLFFEKVEISITPWIVKIKDSRVIINIDWQGIWSIDGKEIKSRGIADFVFEGSPLKLIRVDGDDPFRVLLSQHKKDEEEIKDEQASSANKTYKDEPEPAPMDKISNISVAPEAVHDEKPDKLTTVINDAVKKQYVVQVGAWRTARFAYDILERLREYYPEAVIIEEDNFNKIRIPGITDKNQVNVVISNIEEKFNLQSLLIHNKQ